MAPQNHTIFNGITPGGICGATDVYTIRLPMPDHKIPLLGQVTERNCPYDKKYSFFGNYVK